MSRILNAFVFQAPKNSALKNCLRSACFVGTELSCPCRLHPQGWALVFGPGKSFFPYLKIHYALAGSSAILLGERKLCLIVFSRSACTRRFRHWFPASIGDTTYLGSPLIPPSPRPISKELLGDNPCSSLVAETGVRFSVHSQLLVDLFFW